MKIRITKILILGYLLLGIKSYGQTRLYGSAITPIVSPTLNAGWNVTSGNLIKSVLTYPDGSSTGTTSSSVGASAPRKVVTRQFVSRTLIAQTLNGTLTGQVRQKISTTGGGNVGQGFVYFRVINSDGTVASDVGTLTTTNISSSLTNRTFIALTLSSVVITVGQRLCFEVGFNYSAGTNTGTTFQNGITSSGTGDIPVDNTTTTGTLNSWFEFSQTLLFQQAGGFF